MNTLIELEQSTSEHLFFVFFLNLLHNQHSFLFSLSDVLFTSLVFFWSNEMHSSSLFFSKCLNNRQYPIHNNSDDAWQTRSQSDEYHALTECSYAATRKVSPKVDCVHSHHQWSMDTIALTTIIKMRYQKRRKDECIDEELSIDISSCLKFYLARSSGIKGVFESRLCDDYETMLKA